MLKSIVDRIDVGDVTFDPSPRAQRASTIPALRRGAESRENRAQRKNVPERRLYEKASLGGRER